MKMTIDDNDSSNVNETIEKFYKKVILYIEVIRPNLNILFFFTKRIHMHKKHKKKNKKSTKTHVSKQKRQHFYALKNI